jgi:P27 family predicted phage terminase small subunit
VAPELEQLGLLTAVDGSALATYCQAYSTLIHANKAIREHYKLEKKLTVTYTNNDGNANEVPLPEIRIASDAARIIRAFCAEFGLTPSARGRMQVPGPQKEEDEYGGYRRHGKATGS